MLGKKLVIKVSGMSCDHCAATITDGLKEIKNVKGVKVNLKSIKVIIKHKKDLNISEIEKKVNDLGYKFIGVE